ncbi:MAG: SPASM domain-containing protein, partial [Anaerolineales bacterium]
NFVSIPTNGLLPEMIRTRVRSVLEIADGRTVNISFSLDGLRDVHDELRGVPGNFDKLLESYRLLRDLQSEYENLSLRVNSVLMNRTIDSVKHLIDEFAVLFPEINTPALTLLRGSPYDKTLELPDRSRLKEVHNHKRAKNPGKQPLIWRAADWATFNASLEILRQDTQVVPCEAGRLLGVVEANGDVKHCELLPAVGNLRKGSFQEIWHSEKAADERKKIVAKECKCTHECNLFPSMMAHPLKAASTLARSSLLRGDD